MRRRITGKQTAAIILQSNIITPLPVFCVPFFVSNCMANNYVETHKNNSSLVIIVYVRDYYVIVMSHLCI